VKFDPLSRAAAPLDLHAPDRATPARESLDALRRKSKPSRPVSGRLRPIFELSANGCKYAVAESELHPGRHLFCGQATIPGRPWCAAHEAVVVDPLSARWKGWIDRNARKAADRNAKAT
jgi:hypothetical protein